MEVEVDLRKWRTPMSGPFGDGGNPSPSGEVPLAIGGKNLSLLPPHRILTPTRGLKSFFFIRGKKTYTIKRRGQ
jgi:hypothetical protein